ncbi:MAG: AmmeMemoRadiSam system radical enzyme [Cyanobacteria bacterium RYN_339]|nr:AmmeMemoRadiSam system radical enzyme [Cyanobacteria bacterium RYN_339]
MTTNWFDDSHPAMLEEKLENGMVKCHLSPRNCVIAEGRRGFCGVRANKDGNLVTLNYGKSVHATVETIETEAIFHYAPGDRILSMGNIGCMLNCDYCQNWKTSQARMVNNENVFRYTPQDVVDMALRHNIRVISWTYNDPVVWHEFVIDTARLAQQHGIKNLYKSAFFITPEAIEQLIPVIDIFSISIKSMDPDYYKKLTKGWIQPVLDGAIQAYKSGKHVELSTLMVTDISDNEETARALTNFVLENMGPEVPIHFVRFHPDYKMINTTRTPIPRLEQARKVAKEMGMKHVYLGNVYDNDAVNTYCAGCEQLQVTRYGLNAQLVGIDAEGNCTKCAKPAGFKVFQEPAKPRQSVDVLPADAQLTNASYMWEGDIKALHVQVRNDTPETQMIYTRRVGDATVPTEWSIIPLLPAESHRFIAAKSLPEEQGVEVAIPAGIHSSLHQVFDRAHFPTTAVGEGTLNADATPLPAFKGVGLS